jgi:hypothetical protein
MSATIVSVFILISSLALLVLWVKSATRSILRASFEQDYSREVAEANRLEFLAIRQALSSDLDEGGDFGEALSSLERDYEALSYLLRNAATLHVGRYTRAEKLLVLDFHLLRIWARFSRLLGLRAWRSSLLEMTTILEYFGNVVGQRLTTFPSEMLSQ